jgi:hypothetical protein
VSYDRPPRGDVKRLPKWAQEYIGNLRNEIERQDLHIESISSVHPDSNIVIAGYSIRPDVTLLPNSEVCFYLGAPADKRRNSISVRHHRSSGENVLDVSSYYGSLIVMPWATNVVRLRVSWALICEPCRDGGELNASASKVEDYSARLSRELAEEAHAECRGGTWCDCQHKTGGAINADRRQPGWVRRLWMETKAVPLFPDNLDHHSRCWNCGLEGLSSFNGRFHCRCGCEWRNRSPDDGERDFTIARAAEQRNAAMYHVELVDFTKPGAPSSPA